MDKPLDVTLDAQTPKTRFGWLNATVVGIALASLGADMGHEMATAALPAFLASLGAASAVLGLIEGVADGFSSFSKLISGLYGDKLEKRKPLAVSGYILTAVGMGALALVTQWWEVLVVRVAAWLGRGVRSPIRNVLLTEATDPATRGRSFGFERAMDSAGAVIGPLLALLLVGLVGLRWLFVLTLIPGLGAAALFLFLVSEKPHAPQPHVKLIGGLRNLPAKFKLFMGGVGIAGLSDFSNTLLILWATLAWQPIYGAERAVTMAMAFYVGYNILYTIVCYVGGALSDRFPKHVVLSIGYALAALPAIFLLLPGASLWKFAAVFGFSGLYTGIWETVENATAATVLPAQMRGIGFGALATVNGISDFLSSAIVGILWVVSPALAMGFVIVTALGGSAIIAALRPAA